VDNTDYFGQCEDGAITTVRSLQEFWAKPLKQVIKSSDLFLDQGLDFFFITYPGRFPLVYQGSQSYQADWEITCEVLSKWKKDEAQAWSDFKRYRSLLFNLFNLTYAGQHLSDTPGVLKTLFAAAQAPRYVPVIGSDPANNQYSHIVQICTLTATQIVDKE